MYKIVEFSHKLIYDFYNQNKSSKMIFIDATCGNGEDSLFIANLIKDTDSLICYDIQEQAINTTKAKLANYHNVTYHLLSHEHFIERSANLIIYNLGYLPNFDKTIKTNAKTTLESLQDSLLVVNQNDNFLIIIVVYPGHKEGKIESDVVDEFCFNLPSNQYLVSKYLNYNRPTSPYILTISKNIR